MSYETYNLKTESTRYYFHQKERANVQSNYDVKLLIFRVEISVIDCIFKCLLGNKKSLSGRLLGYLYTKLLNSRFYPTNYFITHEYIKTRSSVIEKKTVHTTIITILHPTTCPRGETSSNR